MALRNVIIIGAGGHLGPSILSAFRGDSQFNVSVLSRQSSSSKFPEDTKVYRVGDYPYEEVLSAFKDQDAVVSAIASYSKCSTITSSSFVTALSSSWFGIPNRKAVIYNDGEGS
ncbi:hypothetical protein TSTA_015670 [Talaromyces stipitatus ATCC 10500]|uniref:NAD(P)-binding domain-containing protein n=1 Tax=Talaromyces stipitatus (strain ATCC 10500 / CBS 375.48 / QM 6759 / NRRL 1006) TaxID=441959 RepID=B8ME55_TALSN|nr:uncharacterized protein TSTA_015670 [Talaromyces stipitatus ATCC 10500]EED16482.1 hypothetical protein TSTA_015670 [Talaromyces stipitatus ATCC 10500]